MCRSLQVIETSAGLREGGLDTGNAAHVILACGNHPFHKFLVSTSCLAHVTSTGHGIQSSSTSKSLLRFPVHKNEVRCSGSLGQVDCIHVHRARSMVHVSRKNTIAKIQPANCSGQRCDTYLESRYRQTGQQQIGSLCLLKR